MTTIVKSCQTENAYVRANIYSALANHYPGNSDIPGSKRLYENIRADTVHRADVKETLEAIKWTINTKILAIAAQKALRPGMKGVRCVMGKRTKRKQNRINNKKEGKMSIDGAN